MCHEDVAEQRYSCHSFLILALDEAKGQLHPRLLFPWGNSPYRPRNRRLGGLQTQSSSSGITDTDLVPARTSTP